MSKNGFYFPFSGIPPVPVIEGQKINYGILYKSCETNHSIRK